MTPVKSAVKRSPGATANLAGKVVIPKDTLSEVEPCWNGGAVVSYFWLCPRKTGKTRR